MDPTFLLLSTRDTQGGAARAAFRLHQGLLMEGWDSRMLVQYQDSDSDGVISNQGFWPQMSSWIRSYLDVIPLQFYPNRSQSYFSTQSIIDPYLQKINQINPDIVNLHWISGGFLRLETLARIQRPLVWTLHDMWAFTGGCHYNEGCEIYMARCGNCPQLGSHQQRDLSLKGWQRKERLYPKLNLTLVTPSAWLAEEARRSPLLQDKRVEVIPNGLNLEIFQPRDKNVARELLNLPQNKKLILFGAQQAARSRKGGDLLQETIKQLAGMKDKENYEIVLFGKGIAELSYDFPVHQLGLLRDQLSLNLMYAAADVFVAPSRQDNLPNTIMEALASGTPCAGFKIGGVPEMIDHEINGFIANPFDTGKLALGLKWILEDKDRWQKLSKAAREKAVREYDQYIQVKSYQALFNELI